MNNQQKIESIKNISTTQLLKKYSKHIDTIITAFNVRSRISGPNNAYVDLDTGFTTINVDALERYKEQFSKIPNKQVRERQFRLAIASSLADTELFRLEEQQD